MGLEGSMMASAAVQRNRHASHSPRFGLGLEVGGPDKEGMRGRDSGISRLLAASVEESADEMPSNFLCPISLEPMRDPVTLCTGQTYERHSIEKWLAAGNRTCPTTMQRLADSTVIPNHTLRHVIEEWHKKQTLKAVRRAKKQSAPLKETTPAEVRALLEEIVLCKGLEDIMLSKGHGIIMKDLNGQEVRVLSSPEYSDTIWKQAIDSSLHQELVDGLLQMDIKEGVTVGRVAESGCQKGVWECGDALNSSCCMVIPSLQELTCESYAAGEAESQDINWPRLKDAHQHALVMDSIRGTQIAGRSPSPLKTTPQRSQILEPVKSDTVGAAESPRLLALIKDRVSENRLQRVEPADFHKKGANSPAKWRDLVVAKWRDITAQALRRGAVRGQKTRSPANRGAGKQAVQNSAGYSGGNQYSPQVLKDSAPPLKVQTSLPRPPKSDYMDSQKEETGPKPSHRRHLSGSRADQTDKICPNRYDFASERVAVDPFTWEDLVDTRNLQEPVGGSQRKGVHSPAPSTRFRSSSGKRLDGLSSGSEQVVTSCKWPLQRLISNSRSKQTSGSDRHQGGKYSQQGAVAMDWSYYGKDPPSSPMDPADADGYIQEIGSLSDFGREISLYSPQEMHVSMQDFASPEQISLLSGPLSGPISPLSVLEASASPEIVSPFSRHASTGGASPLSGFTSPFYGQASPLSGPLSGPISGPMSGPLSPFSMHSSSRSQSMGYITPPPTVQDECFPFGQDDFFQNGEFSKWSKGSIKASSMAEYGYSDDGAASTFPMLFSQHCDNGSLGGLYFPTSGHLGEFYSPMTGQVEHQALSLGQPENDILVNPPPSPNKNFPSPVSGPAELCPSGQDGLQAMRLEALKKLQKLAASEQIHRLGMVDETIPVLLTALEPFSWQSQKKADRKNARECAVMVVKILVLLMPLTVSTAAQLTEQVVLDTLIAQMGEDATLGSRISVVTLLGHIVETLVDGIGSATGVRQTSNLDVDGLTGGDVAARRFGQGWSGRIASGMLDSDPHTPPCVATPLDHRSVSQIVVRIAMNCSLLQMLVLLLQSGRRHYQAAIASVSTIYLLCTHCSKALLPLISLGAVPSLVDLIPLGASLPEDRATDRTAKILHLLELICSTEEGRLALMHHYRSLMPRLVACLRPKNERRTEAALTVLSSVIGSSESGRSDKLSVAAVEAGAASKLVLLIQSGCSVAIKAKCTELLKFLSNKYSATTMFLYHNDLTQTLQ